MATLDPCWPVEATKLSVRTIIHTPLEDNAFCLKNVLGKLDWYERLRSLKVPSGSCLLCRGSKEEVSPARHGKYAEVLGVFGISE